MDTDAIIEAEKRRKGDPDPVSGAFSRLYLTQGTLLKEEYDHGTHFFAGGTVLGAAVVDTVGLIHLNMKHGFPLVDGVLKAQATALKTVCPKGKVVRIHGDAFAVVLGPTAEQPVTPELRPRLKAALEQATQAALADPSPVAFHVALLNLRVVSPPNFDVLGPLLWGECERALVLESRAPSQGVLERKVDFDATV